MAAVSSEESQTSSPAGGTIPGFGEAGKNEILKRSPKHLLRGFVCFRSNPQFPSEERSVTVDDDDDGDGVDIVSASSGERRLPDHLVIMVNGLIGSAQNWRYAAKQFLKKYPQDVIVHCSECNPSRLTFDGVDVMGERVAKEVLSVVKRHPYVRKISFIGHSLGGLVARYAIARLYSEDLTVEQLEENMDGESDSVNGSCSQQRVRGMIAGLEPVNFITCATPNLGSRGHKQVPVFCGFYSVENAACHASKFLGRTGKHLFLTDGKDGKPPLLLQMVKDSENLKFMSALRSFRRRMAYSNIRFDHLVGWSTASIRRRSELPKRRHLSKHEKYPHIVNVEDATSVTVPQKVCKEAKVRIGNKITNMEEEMISSLTKLSWERVEVDFKGSLQRLFAHSTIQVKNHWLNSDGADVISHMVDNFVL